MAWQRMVFSYVFFSFQMEFKTAGAESPDTDEGENKKAPGIPHLPSTLRKKYWHLLQTYYVSRYH